MKLNENTTYKNLWNPAKAMLTRKFRALNAYTRKGLKSLIMLPRKLKKEENIQSKVSRGKYK